MRASPFFEGIEQLDFEVAGQAIKTPAFYYDAAAIEAIFPARLSELRELMPDSRYVPARLAPGVGALAISCLEYRDTDIGPYNELAIAVVLNEPWFRPNLPGRALAEMLRRRQEHAFIVHLPVTTEIALRAGIDFYGFPKFMARIEFSEAAGTRVCRLAEGQVHILTFSGAQLPTTPQGKLDTFCHLWMDGQLQTAQFSLNHLAAGATSRPRSVGLDLGIRHPIALELERALLSKVALRYTYVPRMEGILFGPEHLTLPLAKRGLEAARAVEEHPVYS